METLEEGWVKFRRFNCKEGYIDIWMGDSINDPNRQHKHQMQLNSITQYFRLNSGEWFHSSNFIGSSIIYIQEFRHDHKANEIFECISKQFKPCKN